MTSRIGSGKNIGPEGLYIISIVLAIAFYAASYSTDNSWFRYVAYGWWVATAYFIVRPFGDQYLLIVIAGLDFLLLALPGFVLMQHFKRHLK